MMIDLQLGVLGTAAVYLALALAVYGAVAGIVGARTRDARLLTSARLSAVAGFVVATVAVIVMQTALLTDDFSVAYVAQHSRIASPVWVKVVTMWAALEGSILLWAWLLTGYTALLALVAPLSQLRPYALAVMQTVQVFFFFVVSFLANPFEVLPNPPLDDDTAVLLEHVGRRPVEPDGVLHDRVGHHEAEFEAGVVEHHAAWLDQPGEPDASAVERVGVAGVLAWQHEVHE